MREIEGILYCNTGDWVESCTALVECGDGTLQLLTTLPTVSEAVAPRMALT
jgi:UDP-2,3-diacylglucosamine pyrophosphatase LpxH